jgi:hypothetical protein
MIFRELVKDCVVDLVFSEYRLVLFKAKAPQPTPDVHDGHPNSRAAIILQAQQPVQAIAETC